MTTYAQLPSGVIAPEQLARSVVAEMLFANHGAYRTAARGNKATMGWATTDGSADADTLGDLPTLRRQSRDLVRNEPLPAGAINSVVTAVVGTGVVPQARIDRQLLGLTDEQATAFERQAERIFNSIASRPLFDAEGRSNFWQMQDIVQRSKLESGDVFAVRRYIERPGKLLGLCLQLVEADRVTTPADRLTDKRVREGVETDANGMPVAYHIMQVHPGECARAPGSDKFTRVPAYDSAGNPLVLAVVPRKRPGQTRGVPYLAPVIEPLKQLSRYTEAEVTAAVLSGMFAVFVKSPSPTGPLASMNAAGLPGQVGVGPSKQTSALSRLQSGMIVDLAPGEEIQTASATRPNTAFDPFVMAVLRQIGVALELPFEILVKHFTASYSAARAAIMEAWRFYQREREFLVEAFCRPVWEWAITEAVARGLLDAPGFFDDPLVRDAWLGTEWIGAGAPQIDPLKEANAATAWNKLGVLSLQDISAAQARDWDATHAQIVKETKRRAAELPAAAPDAQNPSRPDDDEESD